MRENRTYGSEGGEGVSLSLPLSKTKLADGQPGASPETLFLAGFGFRFAAGNLALGTHRYA